MAIPQMKLERVAVRLVGTGDLLVDNWATRYGRSKLDDPLEAARLRNPQGIEALPATMLMQCLIEAVPHAVARAGKRVMRGALTVEPDHLPLCYEVCREHVETHREHVEAHYGWQHSHSQAHLT